ncbi:MAG: HAD family hydrolase [Rhizobiaceae bacterium]
MTIKAILFDKDGTLLDFDATFAPATAKVLAELAGGDAEQMQQLAAAVNFDIATTTIAPNSVLIAGSLDNIAECLMPHMRDTSQADALALIDALYVKYSLQSLAPFPFLESTLNELENLGLKLGVATNDSEEAAHAHLAQIGITERFCYIAGYDSGHGEKPEPGMVSAFVDHLGLQAHEVMMVGDSPHDCKAGRAAGALAVGVTSGGRPADELAPHADHVVESIEALAQLVAQLDPPG